jgi:DNA-binding SARP family transcriptional activator/TolB-like protein
MFSLRLFGSPSLADENGTPLSGRASQRHRLALLALLATAPGGMSREKLMAYLWPESEAGRARDLLNQAVYVLRKSLGETALLGAGDELRLSAAAVTSDVAAFEAAVESGDSARAASLYAGPFLDGFFLNDAPEFERWVDVQRDRLAGAYAAALERLADGAESASDFPQAVKWWKARCGVDPYDSRIAIRLVHALAASGNPAGALQYIAVHSQLLEEEFGVEPPPELLALGERLRSETPALVLPPRADAPVPPVDRLPSAGETSAGATSPAAAATRPASAPRSARAPRRAALRQSILRYSLPLLAGAAVLLAAVRIGTRTPAPAAPSLTQPTIAVLPLVGLGDGADDASFAAGLTDELIALLSRQADLRVLSAPTLFRSPDGPPDVRSLADSLHVDYVLEGGVQRSRGRVRVRMRLVNVGDGLARWSESYDRDFEDIFAVQDDIARSVARALGSRFGASGSAPVRPPTHSVAAYELYLRGSDRTLLRSDSTAHLGLAYFEEAIALDSTYAAAWAGLARMQARVRPVQPGSEGPRHLELAEQAARRAVALDESLPEAHATLGMVHMVSFDFAEAERHMTRAIELDPAHVIAYEWLVTLNLWTERFEEALAHADRALQLDPLSPYAHAELARALLFSGRCDEALAIVEQLMALQPPLLRVAPIAALCHAHRQSWPEAIALLRAPADMGVGLTAVPLLGHVLGRAGQREEALDIRATLLEQWHAGATGAFQVALVEAGLGNVDETFVWLDRALEDGSLSGGPGDAAYMIVLNPLLTDAPGDPRVQRLRARLGLQKR